MNETKFADSGEEESLGRFAQYIDYPKEMPFPNMRFECGGPAPRPSKPIEQIDKPVVLDGLKRSKRDTKTKGEYGKGTHSFALLGLSDFDKVIRASPRAEHLVKELKKRTTA